MAYSDVELLARLIQCEAGGEGERGMMAVANTVMNRVRANEGEYARTGQGQIRNVIFQPGQFECALEGRAQSLYNMRPEAIHYNIANRAIQGERLADTGETLWFFNPYSDTCPTYFPSRVGAFQVRIGNHCFYNPTSDYLET